MLIKNETIKVEDIKNKFNNIFDAYCSFSNFKNNYPDFESELFYFHCIRYMLETYKELKYKRFIKKILMTDYISIITYKIKNGQIKDNLIKVFYYYIMNTQYNFKKKYLDLLKAQCMKEKTDFLENDDFIIYNNNLCSKKNINEILIENVDDYLINNIIEEKILYKTRKNELIKNYYSIKGLLKHLSFKKEDGDKFWNEFLTSKILDGLVKKLYDQKNIFNQEVIINLFKENSYYFPNSNNSFLALSHKELFNMYFPPSKINPPVRSLKNSFIMKMIDRAVDKVEIQHEWGHTSSSFLFFSSKIKYFETPKRNVKFREKSESEKNEKTIKEGGKTVEALLYGRNIEELTAKEAIFILNGNNYDLSVEDFYSKFNNLQNRKLIDVFNEAIKCPKIDDCVKKALEEYNNKDTNFQSTLEDFSSKIKFKKKSSIDLENHKFEVGKNVHHKYSGFIKNKLNK